MSLKRLIRLTARPVFILCSVGGWLVARVISGILLHDVLMIVGRRPMVVALDAAIMGMV